MNTGDLVLMFWRTGGAGDRVIYVMVGDEPSKDDILIGAMIDTDIAAIAVLNHNNHIASLRTEGVIS